MESASVRFFTAATCTTQSDVDGSAAAATSLASLSAGTDSDEAGASRGAAVLGPTTSALDSAVAVRPASAPCFFSSALVSALSLSFAAPEAAANSALRPLDCSPSGGAG